MDAGGIYPTREDAVTGIAEHSFFVARSGHEVIGTMSLNHKPENGYESVKWRYCRDYGSVLVIHTLAVHPAFVKMGIGAQLMGFAESFGKQNGMKAIRLDVYENSTPAITLYKRCGYQYMGSVDLGYGCYALDLFKLYEKIIVTEN